jgi:hypothetical protein
LPIANKDSNSCSRASVKPSSTTSHSGSVVGTAGKIKPMSSVHKRKCSHGGHAAQNVQAANEQFLACAAALEGSPAP